MVKKRHPIFTKLLKSLKINSSKQNDNLIMAINLALNNESRKSELIDNNINLSFATDSLGAYVKTKCHLRFKEPQES
ncbi:hypothetical protein TUM19329_20440 [Legionella antarctica]|uniref:Uncharacterized protein n=1 Tax=Legionella antarctica TaxID=2708020 RepID=A0A6F8T650_9GAMM|nr:hypothetical protein TUM19329_20440 [Legionella antarctica]